MFKKLVVVLLILLSLGISAGCGEEENDSNNQQNSENNPYNGTWKGYIWSSYYNSGVGNVVVSNGTFNISGTALNFCGSGPIGVGYTLSGSINKDALMTIKLTGALSPAGTSGTGACQSNECWAEIDFYPCGTYAYTALFLQLTR